MRLQSSLLLIGLLILALFHLAATISHCDEFQNGNNYTAYESMLLTDENLVELEKGFFPTNYHSSVVLDVEYHFIFTGSSYSEEIHRKEVEIVSRSELQNSGVYSSDANVLQQQEESPFLNLTAAEISHYHFRWVISPINLFIRPGLLTSLSLNAYQTRNPSIDLYLGLPINCSPEVLNRILNSSASVCDHPPAHLRELNTLTSNVSWVAC